MLLTSLRDSCILIEGGIGSLEMVFNRLSKFSFPVVFEPPLLPLNEEQMDDFPNELYAALLNPVASSIFLLARDCSGSNLNIKIKH